MYSFTVSVVLFSIWKEISDRLDRLEEIVCIFLSSYIVQTAISFSRTELEHRPNVDSQMALYQMRLDNVSKTTQKEEFRLEDSYSIDSRLRRLERMILSVAVVLLQNFPSSSTEAISIIPPEQTKDILKTGSQSNLEPQIDRFDSTPVKHFEPNHSNAIALSEENTVKQINLEISTPSKQLTPVFDFKGFLDLIGIDLFEKLAVSDLNQLIILHQRLDSTYNYDSVSEVIYIHFIFMLVDVIS